MPLVSSDKYYAVSNDGYYPEVKNHAPSMSNISAKTIKVGQKLTFLVVAGDPDGDTLIYSVVGLPAGASFKNKTFAWIPTSKQVGIYKVTFRVSDGKLTNSRTVQITVKK